MTDRLLKPPAPDPQQPGRDPHVPHRTAKRACLDYQGIKVPLVCYYADIAWLTGINDGQLCKLVRSGRWPLPEILPRLDGRRRWRGQDVIAFLEGQYAVTALGAQRRHHSMTERGSPGVIAHRPHASGRGVGK